ncbi:MAG TPA: S26 family signal peptidase [Thermoanaerobaculia bacterium]|nr:S26 family signal peptidase [Thermoanaerobaculia bacterium]
MQNATRKRSGLEIVMWVIVFTMAIAVAVTFMGGFVRTFRSRSSGMEPAVPNGALLIVVRSRTIHRGDIIAFRYA